MIRPEDGAIVTYLKHLALAGLAVSLGGCGQGDSGNVMGAGANPLTPAQVDAALGPEVANEAGNDGNSAAQANAVEPAERPAAAKPSTTRSAPAADPGPAEAPEDNAPDTPVQDNGSEL